jgi:asparagine synthase (glutamine-hydrolysing)
MCGITGFWDISRELNDDRLNHISRAMTDTLLHRGPDDGGVWSDQEVGLSLGHRRLAIVDLSPQGHQPMTSAEGRYVIVFNGEIYNFLELQHELKSLGHRFRGHSDTEVMLAAVQQWGLDRALERFNGMFAFALWDRQERVLHLARDRFGEKPLYYGWVGNTLLFASELKALKAHPAFRGEVNRDALTLYLRYCYLPAPYSIYQDIYKLSPGTVLSWNGSHQHRPSPIPYWSAKDIAERGVAAPFRGSDADAVEQLDELLQDAIGLRMVADVPLGAFLSGGIDSSTIVALMQAQSSRPVKTFTIGFNEENYNEAKHAKAVAKHIGTDHTELYVTPEDALAVIPKLPSLYDEPFADVSQIPTFLVSQLAKQDVTVSLSGDAGDELFGGYNRYLLGRKIWKMLEPMPFPLRKRVSRQLGTLPPGFWNRSKGALQGLFPNLPIKSLSNTQLQSSIDLLAMPNAEAIYTKLVSHWKDPGAVVLRGSEPLTLPTDPRKWANLSSFTDHMMYADTMTYLPDDILVKVDRASMGVSLESRVPFLDHRLMEFAWQLPPSMKIRNGQGKWLLRQVLYKHVPRELIDRPKTGFGIPLDSWLRGPLRDWGESLLNEHRLKDEGFFDPAPIREKWKQHLEGTGNFEHSLWDILMFQAWVDENR